MSGSSFRILLIDDDEDEFVNVRDLLADIKDNVYTLKWASSYEDGLAALRDGDCDACLLDYRLGEYTGLDLLKATRKLQVCPIILLTGQSDFDLDVQAMQTGAADYLVKGQLTPALLERSIRYSIKHAFDMEELRQSKAQILQQDRLASLGLLASSLAHEIGTPLGIIRSRAELVQKKTAESVTKDNVEIIVSQIDKISKLVNSLLHLARGKPTDHASAVSLTQIINDVLNLVQHELERKSIALEKRVAGDFIVKAESGSLGQVLLNLLVNAVHAIEEAKESGRGGLHKIALEADSRGDEVSIKIRDTGCGIPAENMNQIFKPFFTTKPVGVGSGLGLATSYKIVESWGGRIAVTSQVGEGTAFEVTLKT